MLPQIIVAAYSALTGASVVAAGDYVLSQLEKVRVRSTHAVYARRDGNAVHHVHIYTATEFGLLLEGHELFHRFTASIDTAHAWRDPVAELLFEGLMEWALGAAILGPLARDIDDEALREQITLAAGQAWSALSPYDRYLLFRWARMLDAQRATD